MLSITLAEPSQRRLGVCSGSCVTVHGPARRTCRTARHLPTRPRPEKHGAHLHRHGLVCCLCSLVFMLRAQWSGLCVYVCKLVREGDSEQEEDLQSMLP